MPSRLSDDARSFIAEELRRAPRGERTAQAKRLAQQFEANLPRLRPGANG